MKKASGLIALLLLVVLTLSVFVGCGMFGKNTVKYRNETALTVGNQKITMGKLIDSYNQYANYGYTADTILPYILSSMYTQYIKIDAYLDGATYDNYVDALSATQKEYVKKYIKYLIFTNFDSGVEEELAKDYTLNAVETEDTSRDFTEYDDLKGAATYTDYLLAQLFTNEDMDEYYGKYYATGVKADSSVDEYINDAATQAKLDEYNDRLDKDEDDTAEITLEQFKKIQDKVVKKYVESIEKAYEVEFDEFFNNQVSDASANLIAQLYDIEQGKAIDGTVDATNAILTKLENAYKDAAAAKEANYKFKDTFVSDIEGLGNTSDIYTVPADYDYIFVKNILVPFSAAQKAVLTNLQTKLGTKDHDYYREVREQLASEIVADDFNSEKNDDGEYSKVEGLFTLESGKVALKADGAIATAINGAAASESTIIDLMKRFNTDTAQHTARYDYVVRLNAPDDYTAKWVEEFVVAAEEAYALSSNGTTYGTYALCVSDYGVHIVFYTGKVTAHTFDKTKYLDTTTREYELFKTEYSSQKTELLEKAVEELQKEYFITKDEDGNVTSQAKITFGKVMDDFIKELGIDYDINESITYTED